MNSNDAYARDVAGRQLLRDINNTTFGWYVGITTLIQHRATRYRGKEPCKACRADAPCPNGARMLEEELARTQKAASKPKKGWWPR